MNAWLPRSGAQWIAVLIGVAALLLCLLQGFASPQQGLLSYLFAYLFFTGLSLGSLAIVMVHLLTGGAWGEFLRPSLLAAARVLPLQAVLVLPLLFGLHALFPWARADVLAQDPLLRQQSWYLDPAFFVIRTAGYFVLWLYFVWAVGRALRHAAHTKSLARLAAVGLIVYALTTLGAATDWVMSLVPHWHSSAFGMTVATGWMLAGAALAILRTLSAEHSTEAYRAGLFADLGNLLLMFVLAWSYLAFMEYLTIWIADLPAETVWYRPRTLTSWRLLAWFLILCHFAVPFAVLLSRRAKQHKLWLSSIAGLLLVSNLIDALWLVVPNFRPRGFDLQWTDLLAPIGMGALWWSCYLGRLEPAHG